MNFLIFAFISLIIAHVNCQRDIGISRLCGKMSSNQAASVNGAVTPNNFGWHVRVNGLVGGNTIVGSGALINDRWVLTAASLFYDGGNTLITDIPLKYAIDAGVNDVSTPLKINENTFSQPGLGIEKVFIHPNYLPTLTASSNPFQNNLALVKLALPVRLFSQQVYPVCVPDQSSMFQSTTGLTNKNGWLTGWGATTPAALKQNKMVLLSDVDSKVSANDNIGGYALNNLAQVGANAVATFANNVDTGSPIVVLASDSNWYLYSILSTADTNSNGQTVNQRVSFYSNWIKSTVKNNTST
jgi:hypothetical protein